MNDPERFPGERLAQFTGEPVERLREWRDLKLIGQAEVEGFEPMDVERVRLVQLALRRGVSLEAVVERAGHFLSEASERLFPHGVGPLHSLDEVAEMLGLDSEFVRRLCEAAGIMDRARCLEEDDLVMIRGAKRVIDAGFPEEAVYQVFRVYADTLGRAAEAGQHAFHFYVHAPLRASGLSENEVEEGVENVARLTRTTEPMILYFLHKGQQRVLREDRVLHLAEHSGLVPLSDIPGQIDRATAFVDLSSFTPMTEAMGDPEAAAVLERFSQIVRNACTRNDGRVVKQVGDAFMLVFADAASATACALDIVDGAARAGVHWGQVLYREGDYVGSNVNMASRVATEAERHEVLLTEAARAESKTLADVTFVRIGKRRLKGLPEETVLFEAQREAQEHRDRLIDPVCGMEMSAAEVAARLTLDGREQSFCSDECLRRYVAAPEKYG